MRRLHSSLPPLPEEMLTWVAGLPALWIALNLPRWESDTARLLSAYEAAAFWLPLVSLLVLGVVARRAESEEGDGVGWRVASAGCVLFLLGRLLSPFMEASALHDIQPPMPRQDPHYAWQYALQKGILGLLLGVGAWAAFTAAGPSRRRYFLTLAAGALLLVGAVLVAPVLFRVRPH